MAQGQRADTFWPRGEDNEPDQVVVESGENFVDVCRLAFGGEADRRVRGQQVSPLITLPRPPMTFLRPLIAQPLTVLQVYDQPVMETNCTRRGVSTVSSQALTLLNSDFLVQQADAMATRVLKECAASLKAGKSIAATLGDSEAEIESAGFAVDYLEARHAETLAPLTSMADGPARLLVAARLGRTRLIDNIGV